MCTVIFIPAIVTTPDCDRPDAVVEIPQGLGITRVLWPFLDFPGEFLPTDQTHVPGDFFNVGVTEVVDTFLNTVTGVEFTCRLNVIVNEG